MARKRNNKNATTPSRESGSEQEQAKPAATSTVTVSCPVCGEIMFDLAEGTPGAGFPCSRCGAALFLPGEFGEGDSAAPVEQPAPVSEADVQRIGTIWEAETDTDFEIDLRGMNPELADSDIVLSDELPPPPANEDSSWLIELGQRAKDIESGAAAESDDSGADDADDNELEGDETADGEVRASDEGHDHTTVEAASGDSSAEIDSPTEMMSGMDLAEWGDVTSPQHPAAATDTQFELETPTPIVASGDGTAAGRKQRELELRTIRVYVSVTDDLAAERVLISRLLTRETQRIREVATLEYVLFDHGHISTGDVLDVEAFGPSQADVPVILLGQQPGGRVPPAVEQPDGQSVGTVVELSAIAARESAAGKLFVGQLTRPTAGVANPADRRRHESERRQLDQIISEWFDASGRLAGQFQAYEASSDLLRAVEEAIRAGVDAVVTERALAPRESAATDDAKWWPHGSPFRGTAAYEPAAADIFEGRTDLVLKAVTGLKEQATRGCPVLVLSGPAASGKTSFVRAGVEPLLTSKGVSGGFVVWRRCFLNMGERGENAVESLAAAIMDYDVLPELGMIGTTPAKLVQLFRKNPPAAARNVQTALNKIAAAGELRGARCQFLLVLDQIEELLGDDTLSSEDKSQFWNAVAKLAATGDVWLVLVVREDFVSELAEIPELAFARVEKSLITLNRPTRDELLRIVQIPSEGAGLWFGKDPATGKWLDQQIADDADESPEPLLDLSVTMQALFEKRSQRGKITQTAYDAIGSVTSAVEAAGEAVFAQQTPAVQAALPRLLRELVTIEPHLGRNLCRSVPLSRFRSDTDLAALVTALQASGILVIQRRIGRPPTVRLASLALLNRWARLDEALVAGKDLPLMDASGEIPLPSDTVDVPLDELAEPVTSQEQAGEIAAEPSGQRSLLTRLLFQGQRSLLTTAVILAVVSFLAGAWFLRWGPFGRVAPVDLASAPSPENPSPSETPVSAQRPKTPKPDKPQPKTAETPQVAASGADSQPPVATPDATEPAVAMTKPSTGTDPVGPAPVSGGNPPAATQPVPETVVAAVTVPTPPPTNSAVPAPESTPAPATEPSSDEVGPFRDVGEFTNSVGMKLVAIPQGAASLGSPGDEPERNPDEAIRQVTITKPFHMSIHEVTQAQFETVVGKNPSSFKGKQLPVENVTWAQAVEFCRRLSSRPEEKRAGRLYRLPTEAEWEYACRAGTATAFSFGPNATSREANFDGSRPYRGGEGPDLSSPTRCGSYKANAFGLFDMHGNVSEWCSDWFTRDLSALETNDPHGPATGKRRVIRGGSWLNAGGECRSSWRGSEDPSRFDSVIGFRVVCVPAPAR